MFSCSLFTVMYTIISIISSTILKLHMGLVFFLDKICSHEFIGGYSFFYFHSAYVEAKPLGTKTNVFSKNSSTHSKENDNIARGHMGYRWRNVISNCRK